MFLVACRPLRNRFFLFFLIEWIESGRAHCTVLCGRGWYRAVRPARRNQPSPKVISGAGDTKLSFLGAKSLEVNNVREAPGGSHRYGEEGVRRSFLSLIWHLGQAFIAGGVVAWQFSLELIGSQFPGFCGTRRIK
jgi:hypothetical protein